MIGSLLSALLLASPGGPCAGPAPLAARFAPPPTTVRPPSRGEGVDSVRSDTLAFGPFGRVVVYRGREQPRRVVLFVSGDGGWNHGVVDMAHDIAQMDALVVGVDIRIYLASLRRARASCAYPAADFEALSQWVQRTLRYPAYTPPVLVGYSSGASLVYATLAQSPPATFRGGMSLGFCPALALERALCRGGTFARPDPRARQVRLLPVDSLPEPWFVLQGEEDSTCVISETAAFVRGIRGAELIRLARVGHGFGVTAHWVPQFREAFERLTREPVAVAAAPAVRDLPLVELPPSGVGAELAVVVSGDGGWASIDRQIGEAFAAEGVSVIGLNSLQYFWKARTPDEIGRDLGRILSYYLEVWHARDVLLVGYSRGADVLPFMVSRLAPELRQRVRVVALLNPGRITDFEFHVTDWLGGRARGDVLPIVPEIEKLRGLRLLCFYGSDEQDSACAGLPSGLASVVPVAGGHHFGGAYRELAERILRMARGG